MAVSSIYPRPKKSASRKALVAWALFDWANSAFPTVITTFIFSTYFSQAIAENPIQGTQQWGFTIAFSGIVIAILSPMLGAIADQTGRRKPWIAVFTWLTVVSAFMLWFAKPSTDYIVWTLTWVIIGTIAFEVASVFYNAMMYDLVPTRYLGRLSGWGWGAGYLGGLVCLTLALFIVKSDIDWGGEGVDGSIGVRLTGPLVALWFAVFSIPLFLWVPDQARSGVSFTEAIHQGTRSLFKNLFSIQQHKTIWIFLLAHMFYMDGINTIFTFGGIYAASEFGLKPQEIVIFGIAMNVSAATGAALFAVIDDYIGSKPTVLISLLALTAFLIALLLIESIVLFWIFALALSFFVGPVQAASRTLLSHITPEEHMTKVFGLFALSGKATAFLGPWMVGTITVAFSSQRIGMSTILILVGLGTLMMLGVQRVQMRRAG